MDEYRFKQQVDAALSKIRTVLEVNRTPKYPADVAHKYEDKYHLAEYLTTTAIAAQLNTLEAIGLNDKKLLELSQWAKSRSVTLRLHAEERCTYREMKERVEVDPTAYVTDIESRGEKTSITHKVQRTIKEYFWKFDLYYVVFAYQGNKVEERVVLLERKGQCEIMTLSHSTPRPEVSVIPPKDINITWLFKYLNENLSVSFSIDRLREECRTPRRNPDIEGALSYFVQFRQWAYSVQQYFLNLFPVQAAHGLDTSKINADGVFVPVVPLFEENVHKKEEVEKKTLVAIKPYESAGPILPLSDLNEFLAEEKRGLLEKFNQLAVMFPRNEKIVTVVEAHLIVALLHTAQITQHYLDGIEYIEDMLYKQLIAAIGKKLTPSDFTNYMKFHNRRLFRSEYEPIPFCYAIRRPDHYPEGIISIEGQLDDGSIPDPVPTVAKSSKAHRPMKFSINAATKISFMGDRNLHAVVLHEFSGHSGLSLNLVARARQFSSFILMVGTIISADQFEPKIATIILNKDDLKIPLLMETIPTPKEFRDAIESLSPEQQRFAKAFRSMQLSSTLFAICIIQIKPQLEKLLRLPDDSLTKEIRLTQDLMELFIKYQIPSDLLSYADNPNASPKVKLDTVKEYVKNMQNMIQESQKKELQQQAQVYVYDNLARHEESRREAAPIRSMRSGHESKRSRSSNLDARDMVVNKPSIAISQEASQASPQPQKQQESQSNKPEPVSPKVDIEEDDYTAIPTELDKKFEILDEDSALRPTIIKTGEIWTKSSQAALLAPPVHQTLSVDEQTTERNRAFDLLDALTRSGALLIDQASLHVVLAATHCFDKTLIDTVIQDNVNPIEKVERSALIVATTIHNKPAIELLKQEQIERVSTFSPVLFGLPPQKKQKLLSHKKE